LVRAALLVVVSQTAMSTSLRGARTAPGEPAEEVGEADFRMGLQILGGLRQGLLDVFRQWFEADHEKIILTVHGSWRGARGKYITF
jgi:hypothetical protein